MYALPFFLVCSRAFFCLKNFVKLLLPLMRLTFYFFLEFVALDEKSINTEEEDKKGFMKKLKQALPLANVDWGDYCDTNPLRLF
ncbi:hypothetical protein KKE58_02920 [Patescibacteria group bacterium]|nr:hypothetical protein [Patescibacteria group bacterium]